MPLKPNQDDWQRAAKICREVVELPDRTSPDENADFMLVTGDELQSMLAEEFARLRADCGEKEAARIGELLVTEAADRYIVQRMQTVVRRLGEG